MLGQTFELGRKAHRTRNETNANSSDMLQLSQTHQPLAIKDHRHLVDQGSLTHDGVRSPVPTKGLRYMPVIDHSHLVDHGSPTHEDDESSAPWKPRVIDTWWGQIIGTLTTKEHQKMTVMDHRHIFILYIFLKVWHIAYHRKNLRKNFPMVYHIRVSYE